MSNSCSIHCLVHLCGLSFPDATKLAKAHGYCSRGIKLYRLLRAIEQAGKVVTWLDGDVWSPDGHTTLYGEDRIIDDKLKLWTVNQLMSEFAHEGAFLFTTRDHVLSVVDKKWRDVHYIKGTKRVIDAWEIS